MTNPTAPQGADPIDASILSLARVGETRRPVKIVEHPAFRNHPRRTDTLRTSTVPRIPMDLRLGPLDLPRPASMAARPVATAPCVAA
ncbi:MAG TPA: hypothetical protein VFQ75_08395 [Candidatus Limnocylindrales bacterium]|jgi:hypothetical protein|nr:hypothetical protein [Candidatus Limnocylindrales bacterium]